MKKKFSVYDLIIAVLVLITVTAGFMFVRGYIIGKREQGEFEDIADLVAEVTPEPDDDTGTDDAPLEVTRDISAVLKSNSDCIGWIYVKNTIINYPVMHTPNEAEKYLHLSFYKKQSRAGTPFLDEQCDPNASMNTIIYGHNMKNGTMFHQLKRYRNKTYALENPIIEYQTAAGTRKFRVFAVCEVAGNDSWYTFKSDVDEATYNAKIQRIKSKDLFETGITPVYPQKIITLSTCKDGTNEGRILVLGVEE